MKRLSNLITENNITVEFCKATILEAAKGKRKRYAVRKTLAKIDKRAVEIRDFENIKPIVVINKYAEYIKDKKYLRLMSRVLFQFDELPLGSYISAYTLNFLLKELDVAIREQKCVRHYIRYMDDLVILGRSKEELKVLKPIIKKKLAELGLTLKYNYQIFSVDKRGLDVMGFRIFRHNIIVRKSTQYGIYKCLRSGLNKSKKKQSMASRRGQIKHCNSKYLYKIIGKNWGSIS